MPSNQFRRYVTVDGAKIILVKKNYVIYKTFRLELFIAFFLVRNRTFRKPTLLSSPGTKKLQSQACVFLVMFLLLCKFQSHFVSS